MSGGFYRYPCRFFYTYNCPNMTFVYDAPCAMCLVSQASTFLIQV